MPFLSPSQLCQELWSINALHWPATVTTNYSLASCSVVPLMDCWDCGGCLYAGFLVQVICSRYNALHFSGWICSDLDLCAPMVQVLCRSLIMWNSVTPSEAWINSNLPHVSSCCLFIVCQFRLVSQYFSSLLTRITFLKLHIHDITVRMTSLKFVYVYDLNDWMLDWMCNSCNSLYNWLHHVYRHFPVGPMDCTVHYIV